MGQPALHAVHPFLGQLDAVCPQKDLQTPSSWGYFPLPALCLSPCPQSHSRQMLPWALATEGNFSLKLEIWATQLSAFSPSRLYEDIQVENMRTFRSHMVCALKNQVQEYFFCRVRGLKKPRICCSRPESEEEGRPSRRRVS